MQIHTKAHMLLCKNYLSHLKYYSMAKTIWNIAHVLYYHKIQLRNSDWNFGNANYKADRKLDEYFIIEIPFSLRHPWEWMWILHIFAWTFFSQIKNDSKKTPNNICSEKKKQLNKLFSFKQYFLFESKSNEFYLHF